MSEFTLTIKLGNDAMSDAPAIATALREVADVLDAYYAGCDPIEPVTAGELGTTIRDYNGNSVGTWEVNA